VLKIGAGIGYPFVQGCQLPPCLAMVGAALSLARQGLLQAPQIATGVDKVPWIGNLFATRLNEVLTSSPTFALRVSGGGFPLLGDSCSRSTGFLLHRAA